MGENKEDSNGAYKQPWANVVALSRTEWQTMLIEKAGLYIAGVLHRRKEDAVDDDYGDEQPACDAKSSYCILLTDSQLSHIAKACVLYLLEINFRYC
jgi:hypothetical protein